MAVELRVSAPDDELEAAVAAVRSTFDVIAVGPRRRNVKRDPGTRVYLVATGPLDAADERSASPAIKAGDLSYTELVAAVQAGVADDGAHVRAAVALIVSHGHWLKVQSFVDSCVFYDGVAWISWRTAAGAYLERVWRVATAADLGVLEFAIALAQDRYRLSQMGRDDAEFVLASMTEALRLRDGGWS